MSQYIITDFGAVADDGVDSAAAMQRAVDAAHAAGGGTVVVPAGQRFMCGSFGLRSNVRLHLEPGSVLLAAPDIAAYANYEHLPAFAKCDFGRFWILTRDAENVTMDGTGTLDGNSPAFTAEWREENTVARNPRAQSVVFLNCRDVIVRDIHISSKQGVYLQGAPGEAPPSDITFENVRVHIERKTTERSGYFDPRPHVPGFAPAGSRGAEESGEKGGLHRHGLPGFFIEHARDVTLRHCAVTWGEGMGEAYSHALEAWNTEGLRLEDFRGEGARPEVAAIGGDGQ